MTEKVIHCKDCVWYSHKDGCPLFVGNLYDERGRLPHDNDFCSYGELQRDTTDSTGGRAI